MFFNYHSLLITIRAENFNPPPPPAKNAEYGYIVNYQPKFRSQCYKRDKNYQHYIIDMTQAEILSVIYN